MAKLYKINMFILDVNDKYQDLDEIIMIAEIHMDANFICFNEKAVEIEWEDDIQINQTSATVEDFEEYFK